MFFQPRTVKPAEEMAAFYRGQPFCIGFNNAPAANANPGYYPCPLVCGPMDGYWSGMMSGVITKEEMDEVTRTFEKEMAAVPRRDNHEELRSLVLERLWLKPYGKYREAQRKHAKQQKERREYNAHVERLKEREIEKQAREDAFAKKRRKEKRRKAREERLQEVLRLAECPIWRRDHRNVYETGPDGKERLTYESEIVQQEDEGYEENDEGYWEAEEKLLKEALAKLAAEEEELEEGEVDEVEEEAAVKQEQLSPSLDPKRGRGANASWRKEKRARVIHDDDSD